MKTFLTILLTFFAINSQAEEQIVNPLIYCLGNEEMHLHKSKTLGGVYKVNKLLIEEVTSFNQIHLKNKYLQEICYSNSPFSPSINFLRYLMIYGKEIFDFKANESDVNLISLRFSINNFVYRSPEIFLTWISEIQADLPSHNCLDKYIPGLSELKFKIQYLEAEIGTQRIFMNKKLIEKIFQGLKSLDHIIQKCKKDHKKREHDIENGKII